MLINKLRERTKQKHEMLEQAMFPLITRTIDIKNYVKLLHVFYGYYQSLQNAIDSCIDISQVRDYASFRKANLILDDLTSFGEPINNIPICELDFSIVSHADAMGALYVTEGSTLGGKIICKTIATNLAKKNLEGISFFNGYGSETGQRWKSFLSLLDSYSNSPKEDAIIESANNVFDGFEKWLRTSAQQE